MTDLLGKFTISSRLKTFGSVSQYKTNFEIACAFLTSSIAITKPITTAGNPSISNISWPNENKSLHCLIQSKRAIANTNATIVYERSINKPPTSFQLRLSVMFLLANHRQRLAIQFAMHHAQRAHLLQLSPLPADRGFANPGKSCGRESR